jgi:peptidoglycan/LPS O-acetylase OafA/YrhL
VPWYVHNAVSCGYLAVSLFFILSGFILTYVHLGPRAAPLDRRDFYANRLARIYPAYLFGLAIIAPFFVGHTVRTAGVAVMLQQAVAVLTLTQAYFPSLAMAWNPPAWSLSAEALFYALFPICAPRLVACRRSTAVSVAITSYVLCLIVPLAYLRLTPDAPVEPTHSSQAFWLNILRYSPVVRLPEFVIGIVLGRWYLHLGDGARRLRGAAIASLGATAALGFVLAEAPRIPYPILHNGLLAPVFALLIASLAPGRGPVAALLATRPLVALGEASYALYVLHVPLLVLWSKIVIHVHGDLPRLLFASTDGFLGLNVAASLLCHRYVERPVRQRLLLMLSARRAVRNQSSQSA